MVIDDLHGAWNVYVGHNAALYDTGKDAELTAGGVYSGYSGIGYLNTDWAYHYFRGSMPPGRINIGVGYCKTCFVIFQGPLLLPWLATSFWRHKWFMGNNANTDILSSRNI